jgi:hypothetical protein
LIIHLKKTTKKFANQKKTPIFAKSNKKKRKKRETPCCGYAAPISRLYVSFTLVLALEFYLTMGNVQPFFCTKKIKYD